MGTNIDGGGGFVSEQLLPGFPFFWFFFIFIFFFFFWFIGII